MRKKGGNEESVRNRALDFNIYRIEIAKLARVSGSEGLTPPPFCANASAGGTEARPGRRVIFRGADPETRNLHFWARNEPEMVQRTRTTGSDRPSGSDRWPEEF